MLKGNQKKLDKNKDGKISKIDFKLLKKKKKNIKKRTPIYLRHMLITKKKKILILQFPMHFILPKTMVINYKKIVPFYF